MARRCILVALFVQLVATIHGQLIPASPSPKPPFATESSTVQNYGRLPLVFEPNRGQANKDVLFLAAGAHYRIDLKARSAVVKFADGFQIELETMGGQNAAFHSRPGANRRSQ